jgi:hypothetical protein
MGRYGGGFIGYFLRFADGGEAFNAELLVVGITRHLVHPETFHQQYAPANVRFDAGRKPDFVIDEGLLENHAGASRNPKTCAEGRGGERTHLLFPQRLQGIDLGRSARRHVTGEHS